MTGRAHISRAGRAAAGFTLIEVLVSILIIGVLLALLIVGLRAAGLGAIRNADLSVVNGIATSVEAFEAEFGFPLPLVHDGDAMSAPEPAAVLNAGGTTPVDTVSNPQRWYPATYSPTRDRNFFLARDSGGNRLDPSYPEIGQPWDPRIEPEFANQRYSKFSLSYYLVGALGSAVDGVEGPGMVAPIRTGAFQDVVTDSSGSTATGTSSARKRFDPFFDPDRESGRIEREYIDENEYAEHGTTAPATLPQSEAAFYPALVDRAGKAYRFYRWEHGNPNNPNDRVESLDDLNIPRVLLDPIALTQGVEDPIGDNPALKSATWAIVGAGPNGLFGTEPWPIIANELGYAESGASDAEVARGRAEAAEDNLVALESK